MSEGRGRPPISGLPEIGSSKVRKSAGADLRVLRDAIPRIAPQDEVGLKYGGCGLNMLDQPTTTFPVKLLPAGNELQCPSTQTLLDACIAAGIPISYNCRSGECGECMASLRRARFTNCPAQTPPSSITPTVLRARFSSPACAFRAVRLSSTFHCRPMRRRSRSGAGQRHDPARRAADADDFRRHRRDAVADRLLCRAGIESVVPGIARTAPIPPRTGRAATQSTFMSGSIPVARSAHAVSEPTGGQPLQLMGPYGQFRLSGNDWRPALCIAGGTGLAPVMSVLDHAAARKDKRPIRLFYGARSQEELYGLDQRMRNGRSSCRNSSRSPLLSDEPAEFAEGRAWTCHRVAVGKCRRRLRPGSLCVRAAGHDRCRGRCAHPRRRAGRGHPYRPLRTGESGGKSVKNRHEKLRMNLHQPFMVPPPLAAADSRDAGRRGHPPAPLWQARRDAGSC